MAAAYGLPIFLHRIGIAVEEDAAALMAEESNVSRLRVANGGIAGVLEADIPLFLLGARFAAQAMHEVARHRAPPNGPCALIIADGGSLPRIKARLNRRPPAMPLLPVRIWVERLFADRLAPSGSPLTPYIPMAGRSDELEERVEALIVGLGEMLDRFNRGALMAALNGSGVEDVDV
ncbi:MAG: hypothetical protein ACI9ZH_002555 [Paracoccaceae bacterium]